MARIIQIIKRSPSNLVASSAFRSAFPDDSASSARARRLDINPNAKESAIWNPLLP